MEAASDRQLADGMKEIGDIPGVLGVNLVFHHNENAQ
jgi:nitrate reductase NapD